MGVNTLSNSPCDLKYSGTVNTLLPIVRISANGVFSTSAHSVGRLTYSLALLIVIGRIPELNPPRQAPTPSGVMAANDVVEIDGVPHIFGPDGAWQGVYKEKPPVE